VPVGGLLGKTYAIKYARQVGAKVIAQVSDAPPLHIDRGKDFLSLQRADWMLRNASYFYDTFVDLYLLAGGACTTFNIGGYGRWASLIGSNSSCSINHHRHLCSYHSGKTSNSSNQDSLKNQVPDVRDSSCRIRCCPFNRDRLTQWPLPRQASRF
jgi:hypothetical protein